MMSDATLLEGDDLRRFAEDEIARHTPANQPNNGYDRCAECHFTRHPCDVYDLAAAVLRLLDRQERLQLAYIEATNPGIDMDQVRRMREPACPTCGVWHEGHYHHGPVTEGDRILSDAMDYAAEVVREHRET
jgi:hypothetical protein